MNNTNSNFDISKEWIEKNLSKRLKTNNREVDPQNLASFIVDTKSSYGKVYYIGLKYKNLIKKIPIIYKFLLKVKRKLEKKVYYHQSYQVSKSKYEELKLFDGIEYIVNLYRVILHREPDDAGLKEHLCLLNEGVSKDIIFDLFIKSEEYLQSNREYSEIVERKIFNLFRLKMKLKRLPIIWIYRFFTTPVNLWRLNRDFGMYSATNEMRIQKLESTNELIFTENKGNFEILTRKQISINKVMDNLVSTNIRFEDKMKYLNIELMKEIEELKKNNISLMDLQRNLSLQVEERIEQLKISFLNIYNKPTPITSPDNVTVIQIDDFLLGVPAEEWRLASYMHYKGHLEPGLVKQFSHRVKRGMTVVDVGGNIGIYTLLAARNLRGEGKIHTFEPTPKTYNILKNNIQLNGFLEQNIIELHNVALSQKDGYSKFTVYKDNCGHNSLFPKLLNNELDNQEIIEVPTKVLDQVLKSESKIDIVKIDAEGSEPFILEGMKSIIEKNTQISIFIEFAPEHITRAGVDPLDFVRKIENDYNLTIQKVDDVSGELTTVSEYDLINSISLNVLLLRKDSDEIKQ